MTPAQKAAATRRIRRRAALWREWQEERQHPVDHYAEQLRRLTVPHSGRYNLETNTFEALPGLNAAELQARVEEMFADHARSLRDHLRSRFREPPHMKPYHRERVVKRLGLLRERPKGRAACAAVAQEIERNTA